MASRIARVAEKREKKRLTYALFGIVILIVFFAIFGLKLLVGFSLLVDRIRGTTPSVKQTENLLLPPVLNPPPEATNSAEIFISGSAQPDRTLVLYVNGEEVKKLSIDQSGTFSFLMTLSDGTNSVSAKVVDEKGDVSELSQVYTVTVKKSAPKLEISQPNNGDKITGEKNTVLTAGNTDEGAKVTINGRLAIVASDGSFRMTVTLTDGENTITIIATDEAGNQTLVERKVTYER